MVRISGGSIDQHGNVTQWAYDAPGVTTADLEAAIALIWKEIDYGKEEQEEQGSAVPVHGIVRQTAG